MNIINTSSIDTQYTNNRVIQDPKAAFDKQDFVICMPREYKRIQWPHKINKPKQVSIPT